MFRDLMRLRLGGRGFLARRDEEGRDEEEMKKEGVKKR